MLDCTGQLVGSHDWPGRDAGSLPPPGEIADAKPPSPEAGPPFPAPDGGEGELSPDEQDLFDAINRARIANGLPVVVIDPALPCAARRHALDVGTSGTCDHVGSDGSWPWDRAMACGFDQSQGWTVNEIAAGPGFTSGQDAVDGWRQSPGHWAAIVHPMAHSVGVGVQRTCYIADFDCCVAEGIGGA